MTGIATITFLSSGNKHLTRPVIFHFYDNNEMLYLSKSYITFVGEIALKFFTVGPASLIYGKVFVT